MSNTIKLTFTVQTDTDPIKLGEAIAHMIQVITPAEELPEIAEQIKAQISDQLAQEGIERAVIKYPPDEPT